uniref:Uncharacterized protein n=1 Tax=Medicago truncatula TaxID=3880 RepID=B7FHA7_MEDTR|nr:unknown [Medicago truncatula]AFK39394.1 unknown [Medicago truncatula]
MHKIENSMTLQQWLKAEIQVKKHYTSKVQSSTISNGQLKLGYNDTIIICIEPFSITNKSSSNINSNMFFTSTVFIGFKWMRSQSSNTNLTQINLIHISNTTIHNNPRPPLVLCQLHQIPSNKSTPHASSSINNQNSSFSFCFKKFSYQHIIFKHFYSNSGPRECLRLSILLEHWMKYPQITIC